MHLDLQSAGERRSGAALGPPDNRRQAFRTSRKNRFLRRRGVSHVVPPTSPRLTLNENAEPLVAGEETGAANCDQQRRGGGSSLARGCPHRADRNSSHPDRGVVSPPASGRKRSILRRALSPSLMVVSRPSRIPGRKAGAGPGLVTPGTPAPDAQASVGPR